MTNFIILAALVPEKKKSILFIDHSISSSKINEIKLVTCMVLILFYANYASRYIIQCKTGCISANLTDFKISIPSKLVLSTYTRSVSLQFIHRLIIQIRPNKELKDSIATV